MLNSLPREKHERNMRKQAVHGACKAPTKTSPSTQNTVAQTTVLSKSPNTRKALPDSWSLHSLRGAAGTTQHALVHDSTAVRVGLCACCENTKSISGLQDVALYPSRHRAHEPCTLGARDLSILLIGCVVYPGVLRRSKVSPLTVIAVALVLVFNNCNSTRRSTLSALIWTQKKPNTVAKSFCQATKCGLSAARRLCGISGGRNCNIAPPVNEFCPGTSKIA